jgi:arginyl-tRNA synthetase
MHLFEQYRQHVLQAVEATIPGFKTDAITLEPPRDATHGDLSTNAAMVLAGQAKQKPRDIAEKLAEQLRAAPDVIKVDVAGPGFINITLKPQTWHAQLPIILSEGNSYGNSRMGVGEKINVEYVSANPTGPLHIGHARGAVYGDAIATLLLKAGYNVTKEYYINDAGAQIEVLAKSALLRYREACGETIEIPEGLYPGDYLKGVGEALKEKHGTHLLKKPLEVQMDEAKSIAIDCMMALIKEDLAELGIRHDIFTSEAKLHRDDKIEQAIAKLTKLGHLYRGVLEPPKGELPDDWEAKEQLLFRSTNFGDDTDRTVQKSNGQYAYFAGDLALTMDKVSRGYSELIYMLGADHGGYVKRLEAITAALSEGKAKADVKLCQLVHLTKNGEPVRMSKRAGNFVTVRDVLDEVGKDILRFVMLMRKTNADMDFDLDKVKEQSKDNPVFYVQYAHARAKSVLRLAREQAPDALAASEKAENLALLSHPAELTLIKILAGYPRLVEQAAVAHEPHRIIYFLQEIAAAFHGLWNVGSKDAEIRIILPDQPALTAARLALARAMAVVLASGLNVCGVEPVEELR